MNRVKHIRMSIADRQGRDEIDDWTRMIWNITII
jgi:hypothetical protein